MVPVLETVALVERVFKLKSDIYIYINHHYKNVFLYVSVLLLLYLNLIDFYIQNIHLLVLFKIKTNILLCNNGYI